jgi:hypothetical protein
VDEVVVAVAVFVEGGVVVVVGESVDFDDEFVGGEEDVGDDGVSGAGADGGVGVPSVDAGGVQDLVDLGFQDGPGAVGGGGDPGLACGVAGASPPGAPGVGEGVGGGVAGAQGVVEVCAVVVGGVDVDRSRFGGQGAGCLGPEEVSGWVRLVARSLMSTGSRP